MNRVKLFIILSVTITCVSCFKDATHEYPFPNNGLKVRTITENIVYADSQRVQHVYTYSYDSIGRIKGIDSDSSFITFNYNSSFTQKNIYPVKGPAQHYLYYYNNDALLDSTVWFTESTGDTTHIVYIYDTGNQIQKRTEKIITSAGILKEAYHYEYKYDSRGNVESIAGYFASGGSFSSSGYNYIDTAHYNDMSEQVSPDGIENPDLLSFSYSNSLGGAVITNEYEYRFDIFGRTEEIRIQSVVAGSRYSTALSTYTYY